jgi:hypothetical protein
VICLKKQEQITVLKTLKEAVKNDFRRLSVQYLARRIELQMVIFRQSKTEGDKRMFVNGKNNMILKVWAVFISIAMTTAGFSASTNSARIIPTGKVSVMKEGAIVGEFSEEAPLPEGVLLKCEDGCDIKFDDTYMRATPGTVFSITLAAASTALYVKTGSVYYVINESSNPIQITTPSGDAATGDLTMSESELRGYVRVSGNETEIGVISGGTLMLETESGQFAVASGRAITITAGDSEPVAGATEPAGAAAPVSKGISNNQIITIGAASAAALAGMVLLFSSGGSGGGSGGGNGGDDVASPASPP